MLNAINLNIVHAIPPWCHLEGDGFGWPTPSQRRPQADPPKWCYHHSPRSPLESHWQLPTAHNVCTYNDGMSLLWKLPFTGRITGNIKLCKLASTFNTRTMIKKSKNVLTYLHLWLNRLHWRVVAYKGWDRLNEAAWNISFQNNNNSI